jgi:hypothetical protein
MQIFFRGEESTALDMSVNWPHLAHPHGDGAHSILKVVLALRLEVARQPAAVCIHPQRRSPDLHDIEPDRALGSDLM